MADPSQFPMPALDGFARRSDQRSSTRRTIAVPARLIWKDARGTTRMATVETRNVSDQGMLVDCVSPATISLFRLVDVHLDRAARQNPDLPPALRRPQVLAAIYRVGPYRRATGTPESYALRLLVKPDVAQRGTTRLPGSRTAASLADVRTMTA